MSAERPAALWRNPIVLLVAGIIALFVGGNAVMVWIAVRAQPDLVTPDYYAASKRVDQDVAARADDLRAGWRVQPVGGDDAATLTLSVRDGAGLPAAGLAGTVRAYRPADAALDQPLAWEAVPGRPGTYRARFARPAPGLWQIRLDLRRGQERLYRELEWVAPGARP